jgi:ethanolamine transporter EutH
MKRIVIIYGVIAGSIVAAMILISIPLWNNGILNFDNGEITGYSSMVIALSLIFVGIKSYRDKHGNGVISFGKAVKIGVLISLIAAVMYSLAWEFSFTQMSGDFMAQMTDHYTKELKESGATEAEIQESLKSMAMMQEYYKNPVIRFFITAVVEILPVGIVITLISAALLRKKEFLPATEPA